MKYSVEWLKNELALGRITDYFGFFGTKKESEFNKSFSNFYYSPMVTTLYNGESYTFGCNEQYFMYRKAIEFKDYIIADKMLQPNLNPFTYKKLGRQVKDYDENHWNSVRYAIMYEGLKLKYSQNPTIAEYLLSTEDKIIVEASPYDGVWGVKLGLTTITGARSNLWKFPKQWKGNNLLGFALMELRDELQE